MVSETPGKSVSNGKRPGIVVLKDGEATRHHGRKDQ